jgi:hypothetical protein
LLTHRGEYFDAIHPGHHEIQDDELRLLLTHQPQCLLAVGCPTNGESFTSEGALKQIPNTLVVVHDQNASASQRHDNAGGEMRAGNLTATG